MPERNRKEREQRLNEMRHIENYHAYNNNLNGESENVDFLKEEKVGKSFNNMKMDISEKGFTPGIGSSSFYHQRNDINNKYASGYVNMYQRKIGSTSQGMPLANKSVYMQKMHISNNNGLKNDNSIIGINEEKENANNPYSTYEYMYGGEYTTTSAKNNYSVEEKNEFKGNDSFIESGSLNNYVELYINKAKEIYYFHVFYNYLKLGWPEKEAAEESKKYIFTTLNNYFAQMKNTIFSSPQFVKRINKCVASNLLYYQEPTNLHQFLQQLQHQPPQPPQSQSNILPPQQNEQNKKRKKSITQNAAHVKMQKTVQNNTQNMNMFDFMNLENFNVTTTDVLDKCPNSLRGEEINSSSYEVGNETTKGINNSNDANKFVGDNSKHWGGLENIKVVNVNEKNDKSLEGSGKTNIYNVKEDKIDEMLKGIEEMKKLSEQKKQTKQKDMSGMPIYKEDYNYSFLEGRGNVHNEKIELNPTNVGTLIKNNLVDSSKTQMTREVPISSEEFVNNEEKKKIRFSINANQNKIYQKMKMGKMNNYFRNKNDQGSEYTGVDNYSKEMRIDDMSEVSNISDDKKEEKENEISTQGHMHNMKKNIYMANGINDSNKNYEMNSFQHVDDSNKVNKTYERDSQQGHSTYGNENYEQSVYYTKSNTDLFKGVKGNITLENDAYVNRGNYGERNTFYSNINNSNITTTDIYTNYYENNTGERNISCGNEMNIYQRSDVSNIHGVNTINSGAAAMNEQNNVLKNNEKNYTIKNNTFINDENNKPKTGNIVYGYTNSTSFYKNAGDYYSNENLPTTSIYGYNTGYNDSNAYNTTIGKHYNDNSNNSTNVDNINSNNINNKSNILNNYNNSNINNNSMFEKRNDIFKYEKKERENCLDDNYTLDNYDHKKNKTKEKNKLNKGLYKITQELEEDYEAYEENLKKNKERREVEEDEKEKEEYENSDKNFDSYETEMNKKKQADKKNAKLSNLSELAFFSEKNTNVDNQKCFNNYVEKLKFYYKDLMKNKEFGKQFNYFITSLNQHKNKNDGVSSLWLNTIIPSVDNIYRPNQYIRSFLSKKKNITENTNDSLSKNASKNIVVDPKLRQRIQNVQSKEKRMERFYGGIKSEKRDSNENLFYFDTNVIDKENMQVYSLEKLIEMHDDISCYKNKDFVGQCKSIQKFFFRLTSLPEPKNVRSFSVLKCTYAYILYKYNLDKNYKYINEQFRSLRQDLNIQSILHNDIINIYETNIRICIVNNDLFQFLQCINKLFEMYQKLNIKKSKVEFLCYKMIYLTLQNMHQEFYQVYFSLTEEERNDEDIKLCHYLNDCVKNKMYLINVNMINPVDNSKSHDYIYSRIYLNNNILNYMKQLMELSENSVLNVNVDGLSAFIKEHGSTSNMEKLNNTNLLEGKSGIHKMPYLTNCLIILFLPKYRLLALINICKTSMKVSISTLTKLLNFENDEECINFLREVKTDISNNDVLTKSSLTNLLKSPLLKNRYINHIR